MLAVNIRGVMKKIFIGVAICAVMFIVGYLVKPANHIAHAQDEPRKRFVLINSESAEGIYFRAFKDSKTNKEFLVIFDEDSLAIKDL